MDKIKDNLPLISLCLLILCTLNTVIYYAYFGVDILSYLDFTETLQIQFKPFAISASFVIGVIIVTSFTSFFVNRLEDKFVVYSPEDFERDYKRL